MSAEILHLDSGTVDRPAIGAEVELPATVNDLPAFYYWRQSIRDGRYIHPKRKWNLAVNEPRRLQWESAFARMRQAGVAIPIVADHSTEARQTLGYVVGIRQSGPWLEELHQYLGEEARDIALRNKVSVGIDTNFVDGSGAAYGEAICHSAIVPWPIVGGQGDAMAASHEPAEVMLLEAAEPSHISDEQLQAVRQLADDSSIERSQVVSRLLELAMPGHGNGPDDADDAANVADMETLEQLTAQGCITPAVRDALHDALAHGQTRNLSRHADGDRLPQRLLCALRGNAAIDLTERSGLQTLARVVPGDEGDSAARHYGSARASRLNGDER